MTGSQIEAIRNTVGDRAVMEIEQTAPGHFRPVSVILNGRELGSHAWDADGLCMGRFCRCGAYTLGKFEHLILKQTLRGRLKLWWCRVRLFWWQLAG